MAPIGLAVVKALYDYEAQSDDELSIKEDQILYVLDNSDSEWWKVRHKLDSSEDEGPSGVVPANYVEEVEPIGIVKALYDYEANADGELSIKEGDVLIVYEKEDDWILVKGDQRDSKVGFVPGTYVEEFNPDESASTESAPSAPVSNYVDPQDRVLASVSNVGSVDTIETWPVTEIDSKGKKRKGTLGIGKGNVFFASESDKTPVQQRKAADIVSVGEDKPKHVRLVFSGVSAAELHFSVGSKEVAQAIIAKAEASSGRPGGGSVSIPAAISQGEENHDTSHAHGFEEEKSKKNGVRWAPSPSSLAESYHASEPTEGEPASAMYDFEAQSEDELTVREGDELMVVDRLSSEDWWKCRNERGQEGVVPSSYVELKASEEAAQATAEAEERQREEDAVPSHAEAESEAEAVAAAARAARERELAEERRRQAAAQKRREDERKIAEQRRIKEEERARKKADEARALRAAEARRAEEEARMQATKRRDDGRTRSKPGASDRPKPTNTRIWHDRTGQFKVEAEFLGYSNGKIKLHKINGVIIEVPAEKMSEEDMAYIGDILNPRRKSTIRADSDDNVPLAAIADQRKQAEPTDRPDRRASVARQSTGPKRHKFDWFEFFLNAGCDVDDCTRYATAFERDKIDESILGDIKPETMRALGLREGDIIRVAKAIEDRRFSSKSPSATKDSSTVDEQLRRDEEYARQLQAEINGNSRSGPTNGSPPNLFTGPGGTLKTSQRRGRPQTKTTAPLTVDATSIASASDRLTQSPAAASPSLIPTSSSSPMAAATQRSARPLTPAQTGFDDNAWEPKPLSTRASQGTAPMVTSTSPPQIPAAAPPTPPASAPPPPPPAPPVPAASTTVPSSGQPVGAQIARPQTTGAGVTPAQTGEFELIAKLSAMRPPSAPVSQVQPYAATPPPPSFQAGLGMGSSPLPLAQLQAQQTGMYAQNTAPRGPLAPVPANQGLLNPLIPTNTGFNGFIPTRPASTPMIPQPTTLPQAAGYPVVPSGAIRSQPTGFPTFGLAPHATGISPMFAQPLQAQFTGVPTPQPQYLGVTASFPTAAGLPSSVSQSGTNHSPASVFASMKAGSFAGGANDSQSADKYDALRSSNTVNPPYQGFLTAQPTGFTPNNGAWNAGANPPGYGQAGFGSYQPR